MRPSAQHIYPILALLLLAGGTVWLERVTRSDEARTPSAQRTDPDFTAEGTRMTGFDADGQRHFELLADRVTHFPADGATRLERPRLHYDTNDGALTIEAQQGEVFGDGERLLLTGDVRASRPANAARPALRFESASLTIWPDDERAETQDPVTLIQGANTARADGMKTDNIFGTLELIGNARVHLPRSPRNAP